MICDQKKHLGPVRRRVVTWTCQACGEDIGTIALTSRCSLDWYIMDREVLCSVLIPSRARPDRLWKTIRSIQNTSVGWRNNVIEIVVRFDSDDLASLAIADDLRADGVVVLVGDRQQGYPSIGAFYEEMSKVARGVWIWVQNDDMHVTGPAWDGVSCGATWDEQLAELPVSKLIVQAEIHKLGFSTYPNHEGGPFPLVPNRVWERFGIPELGREHSMLDTFLDQLLRVQNGWTTHFLSGIGVVHERDADDVLEEHRKL